MVFTPIQVSEIATGQPVSNETQTKIKENFENLHSRLTTLEGGGSTVYPPIIMRVNGYYGESGDLLIPANNLLTTTLNFNLTVTGVRLICEKAGISGQTVIDLKYKRAAGAWTSILTTKPSVSFSAGDFATSTNAVLNPAEVNLQAGDFISLSVDDAQKRASNLFVRIDYIKN